MTQEGFTRLMNYLEGVFGTVQQNTRDAFWVTLQADEDELVIRNAAAYVRSERARYGFPKPGDLLDHGEEGETLMAWQSLLDICTDLWDSFELHGSEAALGHTIQAMGGREYLHNAIREASDTDLRFIQRDFEKLYPVMKRRAGGTILLKGQFEQHNETKWPKMIPERIVFGLEGRDQKSIASGDKE